MRSTIKKTVMTLVVLGTLLSGQIAYAAQISSPQGIREQTTDSAVAPAARMFLRITAPTLVQMVIQAIKLRNLTRTIKEFIFRRAIGRLALCSLASGELACAAARVLER